MGFERNRLNYPIHSNFGYLKLENHSLQSREKTDLKFKNLDPKPVLSVPSSLVKPAIIAIFHLAVKAQLEVNRLSYAYRNSL